MNCENENFEKESKKEGRRSLSLEEDPELSSKTSCDREINTNEFLLQSPNYPRPYPNGIDCDILVYPSSENICELELRFDEFRVEPSSQEFACDNDFLMISDDLNQVSPQKYCDVFTGIRLIEMGLSKRFHFHTNKANRNNFTG